MNRRTMNRFFLWIERKSIPFIEILYLVIVGIIGIFIDKSSINNFVKSYSIFLDNYNSELITIATVFIGIHFTVYTLLMSASSSSTYSKLNTKNKQSLLKILNHSFGSSFMYVLYSLAHKELSKIFPIFSTFVMLGLLVVVFYSSFIFGITIYRIIKNDISNEIESDTDKDIWDD